MPTPPGYAAISMQLQHSGLSRAAYLTFGVDPSSTTTLNIASDVVVAYNAASSLRSIMDNNVTLVSVRVSLGQDGTADIVGLHAAASTGTAALQSTPPNVAVLVHKSTARGGRRGRGRLFLPWAISTSGVDEAGTIATASMTTLQTAMTNWLAALSSNGVPMYLLHDVGLTPAGAPDLVTALTVDSLISTQRRRLGRR